MALFLRNRATPRWAPGMSTIRTRRPAHSTDPDEALRRTLGEAIERYCGLEPGDLHREIVPVNPDHDVIRSLPEMPSRRGVSSRVQGVSTELGPITHIAMRRAGGRSVMVPAGFVDLSFTPREPGARGGSPPFHRPGISQRASSGLVGRPLRSGRAGCLHDHLVDQTLRSRDRRGRIPPRESSGDRLQRLEAVGLKARLFDLTLDFPVPTVLCVLLGTTGPAVTVGCCTGEPLWACTRAIDESVAVRRSLRGAGSTCPRLTVSTGSIRLRITPCSSPIAG